MSRRILLALVAALGSVAVASAQGPGCKGGSKGGGPSQMQSGRGNPQMSNAYASQLAALQRQQYLLQWQAALQSQSDANFASDLMTAAEQGRRNFAALQAAKKQNQLNGAK